MRTEHENGRGIEPVNLGTPSSWRATAHGVELVAFIQDGVKEGAQIISYKLLHSLFRPGVADARMAFRVEGAPQIFVDPFRRGMQTGAVSHHTTCDESNAPPSHRHQSIA